MSDFRHQSVLLVEAIDALKCEGDGVFVDGTIGGGGHAEEILKRTTPTGRLIGIDWDEDALMASKKRLKEFGGRASVIKGDFASIDELLREQGTEKIDGALLDLGVSSHHLLSAERGFSFSREALLDMRMSKDGGGISALDIVSTFTEAQLANLIREYGEERMAKPIARAICAIRRDRPIQTTTQLANIIAGVVRHRKGGIHPATKTFQALRIVVNDELENINRFIPKVVPLLKEGARLAIISFHSLEDRIVKRTFQEMASSCDCPRGVPVCVCGKRPSLKIITKRPIVPSEREVRDNPAARSAKLRVAERI